MKQENVFVIFLIGMCITSVVTALCVFIVVLMMAVEFPLWLAGICSVVAYLLLMWGSIREWRSQEP